MTRKTWLWLAVLVTLAIVLIVATMDTGAQPPQVTICHHPPGNPANVQTITVAQNAVPTHLGHGDSLGACPVSPGG